jgi:hypothetical protein
MKHSPHLKLTLLLLLLLPLAAMAQTYIITGSGTSFSATKNGTPVTNAANVTIANVLTAIRTDAVGADCTIQFGDGTSTLNIGSATAAFNNDGGTWGYITLLGDITSSYSGSGTINIGLNSDINMESKANITKSAGRSFGISNNGTGTLTISEGTIFVSDQQAVTLGRTGTIIIKGGEISATESTIITTANGTAGGKIIISGAANITSADARNNGGTIHLQDKARLEIISGTITNTAGGNAVYNDSPDSILLGGNPSITGAIRKARTGNLSVITDPASGTVFAPTSDYTLDFTSYAANGVAVPNGKDFLGNFKVANNDWGLIASGNDLVLATAEEAQNACETTIGNQWVGGVCKTALQLQEACEADNKVWENNACREKTVREVCLETTGNQWVGETCKTALQIAQEECEADDSKVWEDGECNDITPIRHPQIASSQISVRAASSAIVLENLPQNAKVQIYNIKGTIVGAYGIRPTTDTHIIPIQTKGIYIVKINHTAYRIAVM